MPLTAPYEQRDDQPIHFESESISVPDVLPETKVSPELSTGLARLIDDTFTNNKNYREFSGIDDCMIASLRQRENEYDPGKIGAIKARGGSDVFMGLTNVKCCGAESWILDVLANAGDKPWQLQPCPLAELPPEIEKSIVDRTMNLWALKMQQGGITPQDVFSEAAKLRDAIDASRQDEADRRALKMERKVEKDLELGGWDKAFYDCMTNIVTLKAGFIKGPIIRKRKRMRYKTNGQGKSIATVEEMLVKEWEAPSPFDMYPAQGAMNCNQGALIERVRFTRRALAEMKGVPGYIDDAIERVITLYGQSGYRILTVAIDQERLDLENKTGTTQTPTTLIEGLEIWDSVPGKMLLDVGTTKDPDDNPIDESQEYEINAIKIADEVIYCRINPDPLGRRPYSHSGYEPIIGSFWFKGVPELMADLQKIINAAMRSMCNNLSVISGPQVTIEDINRVAAGEDITNVVAFKVWQFLNPMNSTAPAISFRDITSHTAEYLEVYKQVAALADDYTGIPAYVYGNASLGSAGRTRGGLEMLMNSAARGIKRVIYRIHEDIVTQSIGRDLEWNMLYESDESIKGDMEVKAVGIAAMVVKEQLAGKRQAWLDSTANPIDMAIIGLPGRAAVQREQVKLLEVNPDDVIPTKEELMAKMAEQQKQQMLAAQAGQPGGSPQPQPQAA